MTQHFGVSAFRTSALRTDLDGFSFDYVAEGDGRPAAGALFHSSSLTSAAPFTAMANLRLQEGFASDSLEIGRAHV